MAAQVFPKGMDHALGGRARNALDVDLVGRGDTHHQLDGWPPGDHEP